MAKKATAAKKKTPAKKAAKPATTSDWRADTLNHIRALIAAGEPEMVETRKWGGTPVFEHNGIICTGETYKDKIKLTFAKGAALKDPSGLFNSSLDGNVRRALDIFEGDKLNEKAFKALIKEAAALNTAKKIKAPAKKKRA